MRAGEPRPGRDMQDRPTIDAYSYDTSVGLEMRRQRTLPSGKQAILVDRRRLDEPDSIVSVLSVNI